MTSELHGVSPRGYLTVPRATGWYFPGELTERPRLSDPEGEAPFPSEEELVALIGLGIPKVEAVANGQVSDDTAAIDTVDREGQ